MFLAHLTFLGSKVKTAIKILKNNSLYICDGIYLKYLLVFDIALRGVIMALKSK